MYNKKYYTEITSHKNIAVECCLGKTVFIFMNADSFSLGKVE